jgi:hypothetical protein
MARNVERLVEELEFHVVRTGALSVYLTGLWRSPSQIRHEAPPE